MSTPAQTVAYRHPARQPRGSTKMRSRSRSQIGPLMSWVVHPRARIALDNPPFILHDPPGRHRPAIRGAATDERGRFMNGDADRFHFELFVRARRLVALVDQLGDHSLLEIIARLLL